MRLDIEADLIDGTSPQSGPVTEGRKVFLTDGIVLDRLAIETAWKRYPNILVSDGSGALDVVDEPPTDWARQSIRVLNLIDWQARSLQKRQLIESFSSKARDGAYWGIGSAIESYRLDDTLPCPLDRTTELAKLPSRLSQTEDSIQERLINWGYAVCDAAIRKHFEPSAAPPKEFPYPSAGV
jgi:NTE family protein